ncbi:MAG: hypothetical protein V4526_02680 [Patescibacteria group bacterium]
MKLTFFKTFLTIAAAVFLGASFNGANATVGGATFVYDIKYDAKTGTVYYTEQNEGGKGCPPELKAISLKDNTTKVIYSCDDGINESQSGGQSQAEKISTYTQDFTYLQPVNLKKNNISISTSVTGEEKLQEGDTDYVIKTNFVADIFQNNAKKASLPFSGCSADQPLVVDGYRVPGVSDKLLFLLSRKSDCFEGGYIGETLHLVSGINIANATDVSAYKGQSALVPHAGSLVVYTAKPAAPAEPAPQTPTGNSAGSYSMARIIQIAAIAFVVGVLVGRLTVVKKVS